MEQPERSGGAGGPERRKTSAGKPAGGSCVPIGNWTGLHRGIKEATLGVRRPHPGRGDAIRCAVEHLARRNKPGRVLLCRDPVLVNSQEPVEDGTPKAGPANISCG